METVQKINFKQIRDFGEIINAGSSALGGIDNPPTQ